MPKADLSQFWTDSKCAQKVRATLLDVWFTFYPQFRAEFTTHLHRGILIGKNPKISFCSLMFPLFTIFSSMLWYCCHVAPQTVVHNDDRAAYPDITARSSPILAWFPACWLIHFVSSGLPPHPPPSHIGWVIQAVWGALWGDMRRDSVLSPIQKCHSSSAHLLAAIWVLPAFLPLFL